MRQLGHLILVEQPQGQDSVSPHGHDRGVIVDRPPGEVFGVVEQRFAQHVGSGTQVAVRLSV